MVFNSPAAALSENHALSARCAAAFNVSLSPASIFCPM
jgi:hypothetical protein